MEILVFGAGAVGLGLGSCILKSGVKVVFVGRPTTVDALQRSGLERTGIFGDAFASARTFDAITDVADYGHKPEVVLVCTKSFDSKSAARLLAENDHLAKNDCPIVLCQNGWGNAEVFAKYFDQRRIFNARVITGFERPQTNHVNVTVHADDIRIGTLFDGEVSRVADLCRCIANGGIPTSTTESVEKDLWSKMLYNCCLNPMGAVLNAKYGQLGDSSYARLIMNQVALEVYEVMRAHGYQSYWNSHDDFLDAFYGQLIPTTYDHTSSMLQDVRAGHRTEIDALNGAIVRLADERHMSVPTNTTLVNLIRFRESSFGSSALRAPSQTDCCDHIGS